MNAPKKPEEFPIRTILYPTDFSEQSNCALEMASSLARDHQARLIVLHVMPPVVIYGGVGPVVVPTPDEEERAALLKKLRAIPAPGPKANFEHLLEVGEAAAVILDVAKETNCDLIVMGTHGRTGLRRMLLGSVAEHVVRNAVCPVLTVKTPMPHEEAPAKKQAPKAETVPV